MIDIIAIASACIMVLLGFIASRLSRLLNVMDKTAKYNPSAYTVLGFLLAAGILILWLTVLPHSAF